MNSTPKPQGKPRELTRKQKAFVRELIDNPKNSATEAAAKTYDVATRQTAEVIAYENLRKPQIIMALGEANDLAESTLIGTVREWGTAENTRRREIAVDTAKYIHDKVHGKATQQIETRSTTMSISIDLTAEPTDTDT